MDCVNYLKTYQDIPYKIFYNALKDNHLFHAYLLTGEVGTPLDDIAKFLAASIILNEGEPFEINDLHAYDRILKNQFGDFIMLDAKNSSVKIDEIRALEEKFSKTSEEKYGKKVYVINGVENLSTDSINALLKFLEEPLEDTYAFLLTENEYRLLPTIKSRVQTIHFVSIDQNYLISKAVEQGADEGKAQLLSFFYNSEDLILIKSNEKDIDKTINLALETLQNIKNKNKLLDILYNDIIKAIKDKITLRTYIDFLIVFFKEALKVKNNQDTILKNYDNILKDLIDLDNIDDSILGLMHARNEINWNINISLLIYHTITSIFGDKK